MQERLESSATVAAAIETITGGSRLRNITFDDNYGNTDDDDNNNNDDGDCGGGTVGPSEHPNEWINSATLRGSLPICILESTPLEDEMFFNPPLPLDLWWNESTHQSTTQSMNLNPFLESLSLFPKSLLATYDGKDKRNISRENTTRNSNGTKVMRKALTNYLSIRGNISTGIDTIHVMNLIDFILEIFYYS